MMMQRPQSSRKGKEAVKEIELRPISGSEHSNWPKLTRDSISECSTKSVYGMHGVALG